MSVAYVLFICHIINGQTAPPCSEFGKFPTVAECRAMLHSAAAGITDQQYQYADGSWGRADRDFRYICMSEQIAPATWPVYRRVD